MSMDELETIAHDATFQIQCAMTHIDWLRAVLRVTEDRLKLAGDKHGATVVNLAVYHADSCHNDLDCERENLERRIDAATAAPRNSELAICGAGEPERLSLVDFAKGRQHEAARDLGIQQAAISKAIRVGRKIFVIREANGSCRAIEEKPFPSPQFGGGA